MRRKDKEITDPALLSAVLREAFVCRLGLVDGDRPYVVPMNFAHSGGCLYLHSAGEGRKIEILGRNNRVCFEAETGVELVRAEKACDFGARYLSVIGAGPRRSSRTSRRRAGFSTSSWRSTPGAGDGLTRRRRSAR
ncbi:pyridoxamine 5'-phosphate oxidase family protein [Methanoculleus caldifontis]|uniref:pyridoxamine 5'-phosphate oxidase family protein n=1 Tax=Methanoculleus caldifontis TaxID=2651577 RepID=UPI002937479A|nr:pyridoxamine 5'-phosphate oxidase family protein [Methanoculleus sp. Wushi-C6]